MLSLGKFIGLSSGKGSRVCNLQFMRDLDLKSTVNTTDYYDVKISDTDMMIKMFNICVIVLCKGCH